MTRHVRSIIPFFQIITILLVVLVDKAPLAVIMLGWIIPQCVEDLSITLGIGKGWTLVHHLQCVEQPEHDAHFMLANGCSSAKSNSSARAFDMSQREYLRLGALLQNLTNNWVVHVIGVRDNAVDDER